MWSLCALSDIDNHYWYTNPILATILSGWGEIYLPQLTQKYMLSSMYGIPYGLIEQFRTWVRYAHKDTVKIRGVRALSERPWSAAR